MYKSLENNYVWNGFVLFTIIVAYVLHWKHYIVGGC